jgi:hypothetical protein
VLRFFLLPLHLALDCFDCGVGCAPHKTTVIFVGVSSSTRRRYYSCTRPRSCRPCIGPFHVWSFRQRRGPEPAALAQTTLVHEPHPKLQADSNPSHARPRTTGKSYDATATLDWNLASSLRASR